MSGMGGGNVGNGSNGSNGSNGIGIGSGSGSVMSVSGSGIVMNVNSGDMGSMGGMGGEHSVSSTMSGIVSNGSGEVYTNSVGESFVPHALAPSSVSDDARSAAIPVGRTFESTVCSLGESVVESVANQEMETGNENKNGDSEASVQYLKSSVPLTVSSNTNNGLKRLTTSSEDGLDSFKKRKDAKLLKKDMKDDDDAIFY